MDQAIFFVIFDLFRATAFTAAIAIFLGLWFPYLLIIFGGIYDYVRMKQAKRSFFEAMREVVYFFMPPALALGVTETIKHFFPSPRPFIALHLTPLVSASEPYGSFPSGHATFFAALGLAMYFRSHRLGKWYIVAAFLVALGRVAVGVHWPIDVVAGLFVGFFVSFAIEYLLRAHKKDLT